MSSSQVHIVEVGLRDGLQTMPTVLPPEDRVYLINSVIECGVRHVEVGSFVSPKVLPQVANTAAVCSLLAENDGVTTSALVPNVRGATDALATTVSELAVFIGATDEFTQANIGMSISTALQQVGEIAKLAHAARRPLRGYLSCVVRCPYAGVVAPTRVAELTEALLAAGCYEVSLGETLGVATPGEITPILEAVLQTNPIEQIALHLHDTYGQALSCVVRALDIGVRRFDSGIGGFGGCPFAPGASGNLATEDIVYLLEGMGYTTGISLDRLLVVVEEMARICGVRSVSKVAQGMRCRR